MLFVVKIERAEDSRSGRIALSSSSLWNNSISLYAFGRSASSARYSWNHFFHCRDSESRLDPILLNNGRISRPLIADQLCSLINDLRGSGRGGGLGSTLPIIRCSN